MISSINNFPSIFSLKTLSISNNNLSDLSFNICRILKKINSIEDLYKDKKTLEKKSICLATIVKIEFSMKNRRLSLKNLLKHAQESIDIVDNKLGKEYEKKDWYHEIVNLRNQIQNQIQNQNENENQNENQNLIQNENQNNSINQEEEEEKIRDEFENKYQDGDEEFLEFLVEKYPYDQFNKNYDITGEYRKNKKSLLRKLISSYRNYDKNNDIKNTSLNLDFLKQIILEYLGNIKNRSNL
jgi:hypothetical protein